MTIVRVGSIICVLCFGSMTAKAQDPHVYSEYKEPLKATIVYTDKMHILNTPEQVVDLELNFRLKPKGPKQQPERVDIMLWSHSQKQLYSKDVDKKLVINVDGAALKLERVLYLPLKTQKALNSVKESYTEWITLYLDPEEAKKLGTAKRIKVQMGGQEFGFTDNQMNTIRDFANRISAPQ